MDTCERAYIDRSGSEPGSESSAQWTQRIRPGGQTGAGAPLPATGSIVGRDGLGPWTEREPAPPLGRAADRASSASFSASEPRAGDGDDAATGGVCQ